MTKKTCVRILVFLFCAFGSFFLACGPCLGAPAGNPAGPVLLEGNYPTKITLEYEAVFERKLKSDYGNTPEFSGTFSMAKISGYTGHRLDIYGLVGVYDGKVKNFIDEHYIVVSKADIAYGLGVSYVIHQREFLNGVLRVGADAKYRMFEPDIDSIKWYREKIATSHNSMAFKEWQISLALAYQYKIFTPYLGFKYSDMSAHIHFVDNGGVSYSDNNLESRNKLGLFCGIDALIRDNISLNIEGRIIDETAVNAGLNVRI